MYLRGSVRASSLLRIAHSRISSASASEDTPPMMQSSERECLAADLDMGMQRTRIDTKCSVSINNNNVIMNGVEENRAQAFNIWLWEGGTSFGVVTALRRLMPTGVCVCARRDARKIAIAPHSFAAIAIFAEIRTHRMRRYATLSFGGASQ